MTRMSIGQEIISVTPGAQASRRAVQRSSVYHVVNYLIVLDVHQKQPLRWCFDHLRVSLHSLRHGPDFIWLTAPATDLKQAADHTPYGVTHKTAAFHCEDHEPISLHRKMIDRTYVLIAFCLRREHSLADFPT